MTRIYHYDENGVLTGSSEARTDPRDPARILIPRGATVTVPPLTFDDQAAMFLDDAWFVVEDHRGKTVYSKSDKSEFVIDQLGPIPETHTPIPPGERSVWNIDTNQWETRPITVDEVKAEARRRIEATGLPWMAEREISGGDPVPDSVKRRCAEIRAASNTLEALGSIPLDFTDDKYWIAG